MPKKLMDCIKKVMDSGKSESEAWAICQHSTGLKKEKHAETIQHVVELANALDEAGFRAEATSLDNTLIKEAQWQWIKEKGQQLKDWLSTERETNPEFRKHLTSLRQNHWNLIKQINSARTMLSNVWKSMGKPEYTRDLKNVIRYLQRDLAQAMMSAKQAGEAARTMQWQSQQQQQPTSSQKPFDPEETQMINPVSNINFLEKLLKIANNLEGQGEIVLAHEVDSIFIKQAQEMVMSLRRQSALPPAGEWWSRAQDTVFNDKNVSKIHWDLMDKLNTAYGRLQSSRQNITDTNSYVDTFLSEIDAFQQDLGSVLQSIQQLGQIVAQAPEQPVQEQPQQQPAQPTPTTTPQAIVPEAQPSTEEQPGSAVPGIPPKGGTAEAIRPNLKNLNPQQRQHIMSLINEYRKQNKKQ
jgi:predicted HAD superfamily phosphohydrolase YqeG